MRVFVTGATGVIGRRLIPQILRRGHRVTAAGRSPDRLRELAHQGALTVALDLFDRQAVRRAIAGHDAIINLATQVPRSSLVSMFPWAWRKTGRIRSEVSSLLVDESLASGATLFLQESFAPIYA